MKKISRRGLMQAGAAAGALALAGSRPAAAKLNPAYQISDGPLVADDWRDLLAKTTVVYKQNEITEGGFTFHMPSVGKYSSLYGWDSGWQATTMSAIDPKLAASEVEALTSRALPNGRISHNTELGDIAAQRQAAESGNFVRRWAFSQYDEQGRSAMIDPPSYILAAEKIYAAGKDRAWLDRVLPALEDCLHYLTREHDLFGDGLISVIHPWETGTDSSSAYDEILHLNFTTPLGALSRGLGYQKMVAWNSEFGWDPQEAKRRNRFVLEDLTFNCIAIRAIQAVANLNAAIGNADKAAAWNQQAANMMAAIERINWVEKKGCYFSRYDVRHPKLAMRSTAASLIPILTGLARKDRAERVIREHLLNPKRYWPGFVVPFNCVEELNREYVALEDLVLWRGHCIWININYLLTEGLMRYGFKEEARELTRRTARMIRHEGLWEFYDYRNGQGKGQPHFNWPGLVLPMMQMTWPEAVAVAEES